MLLINNEFLSSTRDRPREGSTKDVAKLKATFGALGFNIEEHSNLTAAQMKTVINKFAHSNMHKRAGSAFVVIMSHGKSNGRFLGNDSSEITVEWSLKTLDASKTLRGKPKFLITQACR